MKITLKDGSAREFPEGVTVAEIMRGISEGLSRAGVAATIGGALADLRDAVSADCAFTALTPSDEKGLEVYRHTAAHVMAQAVKRLFPGAKLAIGPAIANGFYYDFELAEGIKEEHFQKIEEEMEKIIKSDLPITKKNAYRRRGAQAVFGLKRTLQA